jgi:hypothetical protein
VKKILFAVAGAFLSSSSSFCMDELSDYIKEYNSRIKNFERLDDFCSDPFKKKLLSDIGGDICAQQAFGLFHTHTQKDDLRNFIDFVLENYKNMTEENSQRFKEILILIAPIVNIYESVGIIDEDGEHFDTTQYLGYTSKITSFVGGNEAVTSKIFKHSRFCHGMMFCAWIDSDSDQLFELLKCVCSNIYHALDWPEKEEETNLWDILGLRESDHGKCDATDVWLNWNGQGQTE